MRTNKIIYVFLCFSSLAGCLSLDDSIRFKGEQYQYEIPKKLERSYKGESLYGRIIGGDPGLDSISLKVSSSFLNSMIDNENYLNIFIILNNHSDMKRSIQRAKSVFTFVKLREENGFFVYNVIRPDDEVYYSFDVDMPDSITEDDYYVDFFRVYGGGKNCELHFFFDGFSVSTSPGGKKSLECNTENYKSIKRTMSQYFKYWGTSRKE